MDIAEEKKWDQAREKIADVLLEQKQKSYIEGFKEGSKGFLATIYSMVKQGDSLEDIKKFCETGLGIEK